MRKISPEEFAKAIGASEVRDTKTGKVIWSKDERPITTKIIERIASEDPSAWVKVKAWKEDPNEHDRGLLYAQLLEHHEKETTWLIKLCKILARRLLCECGKEKQRKCPTCDNDT